jgi:hypothetical protein
MHSAERPRQEALLKELVSFTRKEQVHHAIN